jgi:hypothetical protein
MKAQLSNTSYFIAGLGTTIINLMLHAAAYILYLRKFYQAHPAGSEEFMRQLSRPPDQLIIWAMVATSLTMGYLITTVIYWTGARTFETGLKYSFLLAILFWSSVNFGLYASSHYFSRSSVFADLACSVGCMTISGAFAAWLLGRGSLGGRDEEVQPEMPEEEATLETEEYSKYQ